MKSLHKRITKIQDQNRRAKSEKTRSRKYKKAFLKRQKQKEKNEKIQRKVDGGMSEIQAMFDVEYGDNVKEMYKKDNHLLGRIK